MKQKKPPAKEELSDAEEQLQQLHGEPMTTPKSQAPARPPPPHKEEGNKETFKKYNCNLLTIVSKFKFLWDGQEKCFQIFLLVTPTCIAE